jgi:hypothetical protein
MSSMRLLVQLPMNTVDVQVVDLPGCRYVFQRSFDGVALVDVFFLVRSGTMSLIGGRSGGVPQLTCGRIRSHQFDNRVELGVRSDFSVCRYCTACSHSGPPTNWPVLASVPGASKRRTYWMVFSSGQASPCAAFDGHVADRHAAFHA